MILRMLVYHTIKTINWMLLLWFNYITTITFIVNNHDNNIEPGDSCENIMGKFEKETLGNLNNISPSGGYHGM